ncbi:MAG TPA: thermonuclease family protein [Gaiellales bacterium]|jgi:micrococcal nuclease|nr:thermonuclease family protein [Gaiellales bacterium]
MKPWSISGGAALLVVLVIFGVTVTGRLHSEPALAGRVTYVIDGDTVVVRLDSEQPVHVRLIGVNTPEIAHYGKPGECFGIRAATLTRRLALGRRVVLQAGRERHDRYGRLLAYVRVLGGPDDLERTLLVRGAARTLAIAPNVDRAAVYAGLEGVARRAGRGLWGACE